MTEPSNTNGAIGQHIPIGDTRLYVVERGKGYPMIVLHGGPGFDHHQLEGALEPLTDQYRLILVDQRSQGLSDKAPQNTWTLKQMAQDVMTLAQALNLGNYAILGHSFGAFVALQNAVDFPGYAAQTIVSSGVPSARYLEKVPDMSDAAESVTSNAAPNDQFIEGIKRRYPGMIVTPEVMRYFEKRGYEGFELVDQLPNITQPMLVLAGRLDKTCPVEASEVITRANPRVELFIFENAGHLTYIDESDHFVRVVRDFLGRHAGRP